MANTTTERQPRTSSNGHPAVPSPYPLTTVDVRRKRPPALSFLLRAQTLRNLARIGTLLALDFAGLFAAIFTALMVKAVLRADTWAWHASYVEAKSLIAFAYLVTALLFARSGLYAERAQRPGLPKIVTSLFQTTVVALLYAVVSGEQYRSYYIFYGTLVFAIIYVGSIRWGFEKITGVLLRAAGYRRRALLVGSGRHIEDVAHALVDEVHAPVEMVGFISLTPRPDNGLRSLGRIEDLAKVLDTQRVQEVIIADPDFPQSQAVELVDQCHQRGVTVRIAPSTMEILVHRAEFVPGTSVPLFELRPPVFDGFDYAVKRTFDFVGALGLILLISPLLLLISIAVAISSRGPVLYRSRRPGIGGEPFSCLKFRTMRSGADQMQADVESLNEASGPLFKIRDDPRMTAVGRFLRRFSLDELPQLFNVLLGQMSLVGPRPLPQRDFDQLEEWHKKRYLVLPGITGLWQVSGRSELDFDDLVRLDFLYLERWSVALDLTILVKTVPAVFSRRGAFSSPSLSRLSEPEDTYAAGMRAALPLVIPTALIGASFGVAAVTTGWGTLAPIVMSAIVFSGAAQFAVLAVLTAGGSVVTAIVAATLIASRFLAIGVALGPSMRGGTVRRALEGQAVVDASLILARTGEARYGVRRLLGATLPQFVGWQIGTIAGVLGGSRIPDPEKLGLDALFPAFFLALVWGELGNRGARVTAAVATLITIVLIPIAPPGIPVVAASLAVLAGRAAQR